MGRTICLKCGIEIPKWKAGEERLLAAAKLSGGNRPDLCPECAFREGKYHFGIHDIRGMNRALVLDEEAEGIKQILLKN